LPHSQISPLQQLLRDILSPDCWKLSIPAILYVVQNSLQFVAVSNLPVASFQVSYQMKILTTAAFSVALLRKKLSPTKWLSLFFLAVGVGVVQIQTTAANNMPKTPLDGHLQDPITSHVHTMSPIKGFAAVTAACFTSGLAGVYFEMVLKNSKTDLWVRNIQLSLFSLLPALLPIIVAPSPPDSRGIVREIFRNFGGWAWATVIIQVLGGLITALVIKYSDNILKGFATSLSIVFSFLASVALFDYHITSSFLIGASIVLVATWMYNQPGKKDVLLTEDGVLSTKSSKMYGIPVGTNGPILGQFPKRSKSSPLVNGGPRVIASALGLGIGAAHHLPEKQSLNRYHSPSGSPTSSRPPTPR